MNGSPSEALLAIDIPGLPLLHRGKVRDIFELGGDLLFAASDRISAFDVVMPRGIPGKGRVLTQLSLFWFEFLRDLTPNHLLSTDLSRLPESLAASRTALEGRSMIVRRAQMIELECVARGYLAGSGWKEYQQSGNVCGIPLPAGLRESSRLPEPVFTPATKAKSGHDENISFEDASAIVGSDLARRLRARTLEIYSRASAYAATRGIILADTKFEFGFVDGELVLADEVLTPDSSRFWPAAAYEPGRPQASFDKQFLRDYLESVPWDKRPPAPPLPDDIVEKTGAKYREAYRILTGREL